MEKLDSQLLDKLIIDVWVLSQWVKHLENKQNSIKNCCKKIYVNSSK